jgi:hypothetical protein
MKMDDFTRQSISETASNMNLSDIGFGRIAIQAFLIKKQRTTQTDDWY